MKETVLHNIHTSLGAKMVGYAGHLMPISYNTISYEHLAVRSSVGIFDVSHMGEIVVRGKQSIEYLQYLTANDISKLTVGTAQYSYLPNSNGGIIDDLIIYRLEDYDHSPQFLLVVNAANIEKDWKWLQSHDQFEIDLLNTSDSVGLLAVQGPKALEVLQSLTKADLSQIEYYHYIKTDIGNIKHLLLSNTGYTGAGGFEVYANNDDLPELWNLIIAAGKPYGIVPVGLGARDTLRLEMGYCLYGNDINDSTSPVEAGLSWVTKFSKENFVGHEPIKSAKNTGPSRRLRGIRIEGRRVARAGHHILDTNETIIGKVTSGSLSPSLGYPIALGYIDTGHWKFGNKILIQIGSKKISGIITRLPFHNSKK